MDQKSAMAKNVEIWPILWRRSDSLWQAGSADVVSKVVELAGATDHAANLLTAGSLGWAVCSKISVMVFSFE